MSAKRTAIEIVYAKEEWLRSLRHESAFAVDGNGNILLEKTADTDTPYELAFSEEEILVMRSASGVLFTHNHPRGWKYETTDPRHAGYSFSLEDIHLACKAEVAEIRAVSPVYRFAMRPVSGGWHASLWPVVEQVFQAEYINIDRAMAKMVLGGQLTPEQYQVDLLHRTWLSVAEQIGLAYNRREE